MLANISSPASTNAVEVDVEASCLTLAYLLTCANCASKILSEPQHVCLVILISSLFLNTYL